MKEIPCPVKKICLLRCENGGKVTINDGHGRSDWQKLCPIAGISGRIYFGRRKSVRNIKVRIPQNLM